MKKFPPIQSLVKPPNEKVSFQHSQLARVLKAPGCYLCGMCSKRYSTTNEAWNCVIKDSQKLETIPIFSPNFHSHYYHCLLCGKNYANMDDAALCIAGDLHNSQIPLRLVENLNKLIIDVLKGAKKSKRPDLVSRASNFGIEIPPSHERKEQAESIKNNLNENIIKKPQPISHLEEEENELHSDLPQHHNTQQEKLAADVVVIDDHNIDTMPEIQQTPNIYQDQQDTEEESSQSQIEKIPERNRYPNQKPFKRHDARYLCTVCNEKFFTRIEAEKHFFAHPLVDSV